MLDKTKDDHGKGNAKAGRDSAGAIANAKAWYESICEMVTELENAREAIDFDMARDEAAQTAIHDSVLSVEVRSGWYVPGDSKADKAPAEYCLLLTTGGPALRLIGTLSECGEPETARLEYQDWGTPWTLYRPDAPQITSGATVDNVIEFWDNYDSTLLAFASCFYFGE